MEQQVLAQAADPATHLAVQILLGPPFAIRPGMEGGLEPRGFAGAI